MKMVKQGLNGDHRTMDWLRDEAEAPEHVSSKESKLSEDSKSQRCGKCSGPAGDKIQGMTRRNGLLRKHARKVCGEPPVSPWSETFLSTSLLAWLAPPWPSCLHLKILRVTPFEVNVLSHTKFSS